MTKRCALTEDPAEYWALIEGPTWGHTYCDRKCRAFGMSKKSGRSRAAR